MYKTGVRSVIRYPKAVYGYVVHVRWCH